MTSKSLTKCLMAVSLAGGLASCDSAFDLSNISNETMHLGGEELRLPLCSVDEITLKNILDETDYLFSDADGYRLMKTGDISVDPATFDPVVVDAPSLTPIEAQIAIFSSGARAAAPQLGFHTEFNVTQRFEENVSLISTDLVDVKSFSCLPTTITMLIDFGQLGDCIETLHISEFKIRIPRGVNIYGVSLNGKNLPKNAKWEEGEIGIPEDVAFFSRKNELKLTFDGVRADNDLYAFDKNEPMVHVVGEINVEGVLNFGLENLKEGKTIADIPAATDLRINSVMTDTRVTSFTGTVQKDLDFTEVKSLELNDIPDFLSDAETVLDLADPTIFITVGKNEVPLSAKFDLTITAFDADGNQTQTVDVPNIRINAAGSTRCAIKNNGTAANADLTINADIASLIRKVPSRIEVEVYNAKVEQQAVSDFDLLRSYSIEDVSYAIESQLELGDDFCIVYSETLDGWNNDVKDLAVKRIIMKADVVNTLPLDMQLDIVAIDENGEEIKEINVKKVDVKAASTTAVELSIENTADGAEKLLATFARLDGIRVRARAHKAQGGQHEKLSPEGNVSLKNIDITVCGGVFINTDN